MTHRFLTQTKPKFVLLSRCGTQCIFEMEYDLNKPLHPKRFIHPPRVLQGRPGRAEFA